MKARNKYKPRSEIKRLNLGESSFSGKEKMVAMIIIDTKIAYEIDLFLGPRREQMKSEIVSIQYPQGLVTTVVGT